jgi:carboxypeptidase C (cathepsin A)
MSSKNKKKENIIINNQLKKYFFLIIILTILFTKNINNRKCLYTKSLIRSLPNFKGNDFPCIYSGYITLNEEKKTNIFYVLIRKIHEENNKEDDINSPLSIWLNGGPGISSLFGLFTDMGPFNLMKNGNILELNLNENTSWSRLSNILLIDQPVGTGYSFTNSTNEIPKNQKEVSYQFYKFIQAFFSEHSEMELSRKDIYLLGENYAGKYIPDIVDKIIMENEKIENKESSFEHIIKIKKIAIGNGLFDLRYQGSSRKDLAKGINLLSEFDDESQYDFLSHKCEYAIANKYQNAYIVCNNVKDYFDKLSGDVNKYDVRFSSNSEKDLYDNINNYLNNEDTIKAMHVKEKIIKTPDKKFPFEYENNRIKEIMKDDINLYSSLTLLEKIIDIYKIPIILFAGQFDLIEGPQGMDRIIQSINFSFKEKFNNSTRNLWKIRIGYNRILVAGYLKQCENLSLITIRNAGNIPQLGRPGTVYDLIEHLFKTDHNNKWICPDENCSLSDTKCSFMNNCNGNGHCDDTTGGKCKCHIDFYGSDCSLIAEPLITEDFILLPRQVRLFHMDDFQKDILIEIDSSDSNIIISLFNKNEQENIFDYNKNQVNYRLTNKKLILYLEKDKLFDSIFKIQNLSYEKININIFIDFYSKLLIFYF